MNFIEKINNILKEFAVGDKLIAYKKFKKLYLKNNKNIKMRYNLAVMEQEIGFLKEAELNYKYLIKNNNDLKSKINLYNIYFTKNLFSKALEILIDIESENPDLYDIKQDKAYALFRLKNYKQSIIECENLINHDKNNIILLNTLGLNYFSLKDYEKAKNFFLEALKLDKDDISVLNSLGRLFHETKKPDEAEKFFSKALILDPNKFETLNNYAGFCLEESQYSKAIDFYKKAEILNPNNSVIINNLSKAFSSLGDDKNAEKYCKKALSLDPDNDDFKKTYSLILLKQYNFDSAWKYFDGRLGLSDFFNKNSNFNIVKDKLLKQNFIKDNSKILVIREQGVGDEILYGTMYNSLLSKHKNVVIECDSRLLPLFRYTFKDNSSSKFVSLGTFSENIEKLEKFDHVVYAGSLGKFFRKNIKSFPKAPYLKITNDYNDSELETYIAKNKNLKIGISWKSFKNRYAKEKSLKLEDFTYLLDQKNCIFFNLQYGDIKDELNEFLNNNNKKIITLKNLDLFNNLVGVANLLSKLDIFFTVSNSTAHLAGSLGVKTYLIKPVNHASYHYWNYENSKTPWYNSVTIINKEDVNNLKFIKKIF
tara:strand:- start:22679 stop:24460 length:1782 start_codon:yes stop_codon:yes gene_type:complete